MRSNEEGKEKGKNVEFNAEYCRLITHRRGLHLGFQGRVLDRRLALEPQVNGNPRRRDTKPGEKRRKRVIRGYSYLEVHESFRYERMRM